MMQGQDGVDLEINLNGSKSRFEDDDDLDNMVFLVPFLFFFSVYLCVSWEGAGGPGGLIFLSPTCLLAIYSREHWLASSFSHLIILCPGRSWIHSMCSKMSVILENKKYFQISVVLFFQCKINYFFFQFYPENSPVTPVWFTQAIILYYASMRMILKPMVK